MEILVQIKWGQFCVGVVCDEDGIVTEAAPAIKWAIGKHIEQVLNWKRIEHITLIEPTYDQKRNRRT